VRANALHPAKSARHPAALAWPREHDLSHHNPRNRQIATVETLLSRENRVSSLPLWSNRRIRAL
jgi:hypothetical protein